MIIVQRLIWQSLWQKLKKKFNNKGSKDIKNNYEQNNNDSIHNKNINQIKIITDEPTIEDALDFERYSRNLAEIIKNSTPRFTIGIFGGWVQEKHL